MKIQFILFALALFFTSTLALATPQIFGNIDEEGDRYTAQVVRVKNHEDGTVEILGPYRPSKTEAKAMKKRRVAQQYQEYDYFAEDAGRYGSGVQDINYVVTWGFEANYHQTFAGSLAILIGKERCWVAEETDQRKGILAGDVKCEEKKFVKYLVQVSAGINGGKVSIGIGQVAGLRVEAPHFIALPMVGYSLKLTAFHAWGTTNSEKAPTDLEGKQSLREFYRAVEGETYVGLEASLNLILAHVTIGLMQEVGGPEKDSSGDKNWLISAGVGGGF